MALLSSFDCTDCGYGDVIILAYASKQAKEANCPHHPTQLLMFEFNASINELGRLF